MTIAPGSTYTRGSTTIRVTHVKPGPLGNEVWFSAGGTMHVRSEATFRKWIEGAILTGKARIPMQRKHDETKLVKSAIEYLTLMGCRVRRNNSGAMKQTRGDKSYYVKFGETGSADIEGWQRGTGRMIACECKAPGGKPTPMQVAYMEEARRDGCIVIICHDLDELEEQFKAQA